MLRDGKPLMLGVEAETFRSSRLSSVETKDVVMMSLLELDLKDVLIRAERLTGLKFPRDVIEVSLEPSLKLLCIRFKKPRKDEFGKPHCHGINLFIDKDTNEITAVEIIDWEKLTKTGPDQKPIDDPKRVAREYIRKKLLDDLQ